MFDWIVTTWKHNFANGVDPKTHPVHFHWRTPSRSWRCGRRCRRPASPRPHQKTDSRQWKCVLLRWPCTPSHRPLPCKHRCCCRSWLRPGAACTWRISQWRQKIFNNSSITFGASQSLVQFERHTSLLGCHTACLTSCVWEFKTVTHSYSSSSSTAKHMRAQIQTQCFLHPASETPARLCTLTFPDPHALVSAACCQKVPRGRPRHTLHLIFMSLQHGQALESLQHAQLVNGRRRAKPGAS